MREVTRREFLRRLAAAGLGTAASGWLLNACAAPEKAQPTALPTAAGQTREATVTVRATSPAGTALTRAAAATPEPTHAPTIIPTIAHPHLVVARGGEPAQLVRRAVTAVGGMERFVHPGDDVIIKPNICVGYHTYEYAATTNPWVVGELVKLCLEAGASRVRVMDQPFASGPEQAYRQSGIQEVVEAAGGRMEIMANFKFVNTEIPLGRDLKEWDLYEDALKADVLINVPIAKDHNLARLTLGMKNLMGLIRNRPAMHRNLGQRLADLASRFQPALTVVDAVRILTAHGPTGGNLEDVRKLDTVIVTPDIVTADSYAATAFGLKPQDLAYVRAATEMGLGRSDLANLKIEEITIG
jgi:uncharacterized protein (DUF362 family)